MRPQWLARSRDDAELEALQTDVMRFIAILGLCLAAIFSLVQGAVMELAAVSPALAPSSRLAPAPAATRAPTPAPTPAPTSTAAPAPEKPAPPVARVEPVRITPPPPKTVVPVRKPVQPIATENPEQDSQAAGYTLEFASAGALASLLQSGQVQLYAFIADQFWSVDARGNAVKVGPPSSYYEMQAETVPRSLRNSLSQPRTAGAVNWGVTLPATAISQIQDITDGPAGGNLLIEADGSVTLIVMPAR